MASLSPSAEPYESIFEDMVQVTMVGARIDFAALQAETNVGFGSNAVPF
jgi:hypothetical protein